MSRHAASVQPLPPTSISGFFASARIARIASASAAVTWPSTGVAFGASPTLAISVSMSSGSASTTGPGRPDIAT